MLTHQAALIRNVAIPAFWSGWDNFPSITEGIVHFNDSTADQETYASLAYAPAVREMGGRRLAQDVPGIEFVIKNKMFEITMPIKYELWKFGKFGAIADHLATGGRKARAHFDKLLSQRMAAGHGEVCYDGQYMYDTDHADAGAAYTTPQDNDLTGTAATGVAPTDLEFAAAVRSIRNAMFSFKDGAGDPVTANVTKLVLHVPSDLLSVAERVEAVDQLTGGVGNDLKGKFTTVLNPYLTTPGVMFGHNPSSSRKPFIIQTAEDISLSDDIGGDNEFNTKDVTFGTFGYYNAGFGDWRYSVRYEFT